MKLSSASTLSESAPQTKYVSANFAVAKQLLLYLQAMSNKNFKEGKLEPCALVNAREYMVYFYRQ